MKRRLVAVSLVLALGLSGCAFSSASPEQTAATQAKQAVTLEVVTSYGGDDGSRGAFEAAVAAYEAAGYLQRGLEGQGAGGFRDRLRAGRAVFLHQRRC